MIRLDGGVNALLSGYASVEVDEATMIAWRKSDSHFEVCNVASEDWMTVDDVASEVIKAMGLAT